MDDDSKERVREAVDIVDLVGQYVSLRRAGRNMVGRCPWHDDQKPSLTVDPVRQTFKCWVCDIGGDVFAFLMRMENMTFPEALETLAGKVGVTIPKRKERKVYTAPVAGEAEKAEVEKTTLYSALGWIRDQYHNELLTSKEAANARIYLKDRGIGKAEVERFKIGYAPLSPEWIKTKLKGSVERMQVLELAGNLARGEQKGDRKPQELFYDRFRGRLLFPIIDAQDRVVAFGGRLLPHTMLKSTSKYVNSPETPIFSKQRMLYGLDLARHSMRDSKRALIMEGYTDVIVAHKHGFTDAVACLGTALGEEHIKVLKRYVDKMILVLDGDAAGQKRSREILELFVAQGADVEILTLPEGADPAEFLEREGSAAFQAMIESKSVNALEFAVRTAKRDVKDANDIIGMTRAMDSVLEVLAVAPVSKIGGDPVGLRVDQTTQQISAWFGSSKEAVDRRLSEIRESRKAGRRAAPVAEEEKDEIWTDPKLFPDILERRLLGLWIVDPTTGPIMFEYVTPEQCKSPITRRVYAVVRAFVDAGQVPNFDRLMLAFDDPQMKNFLIDLDDEAKKMLKMEPAYENDEPYLDRKRRDAEVDELIKGFDIRDKKRNLISSVHQFKSDELTMDEKTELLLRLQDSIKQRCGISLREPGQEG